MITARDRRLFFYGIIALFGFIFAIVVLGVVVVKMDHSVNGSITVTSSNTRLGTFRFAAVAAPHKKCSEIGTKILARGGSAVDSAIAASVCVSIFNMQSAGIGGGFLMTAWINKDQKAYVLDAREQAPLQSHENMFSNTNDASISSVVGAHSIAVPGEVAGYWEAHKRFGKLPWADLFQPTIDVCKNGGFKVSSALAEAIKYSFNQIAGLKNQSAFTAMK